MYNALVLGNLCEYRHKWYIDQNTDVLRYISVAESLRVSFRCCFTQRAPKATEFGEIMQNNGHYVVQGHSRSPILVLVESSYATSY